MMNVSDKFHEIEKYAASGIQKMDAWHTSDAAQTT
jgi:hypothetical protein